MGIKGKIESIEIDFEEDSDRGETIVKEHIGDEKNNQRIIKIEVEEAIFIYREYIKDTDYITVDVIPFQQVKSCIAVIAANEGIK